MSSRRLRFVLPAVLVLALAGTSIAIAATRDHGKSGSAATHFATKMIGHNETPAVHTAATGTLSLTINADNTISYSETYSNLSSPVLFSHVHFGQPFVAGGVSFFLCGGGGKPACPQDTSAGPVTGTVAAADVVGPVNQGIPAGTTAGITAIIQEIRNGLAYANVHTMISPGGEIRGQLRPVDNGDDNDGGDHDKVRTGHH